MKKQRIAILVLIIVIALSISGCKRRVIGNSYATYSESTSSSSTEENLKFITANKLSLKISSLISSGEISSKIDVGNTRYEITKMEENDGTYTVYGNGYFYDVYVVGPVAVAVRDVIDDDGELVSGVVGILQVVFAGACDQNHDHDHGGEKPEDNSLFLFRLPRRRSFCDDLALVGLWQRLSSFGAECGGSGVFLAAIRTIHLFPSLTWCSYGFSAEAP